MDSHKLIEEEVQKLLKEQLQSEVSKVIDTQIKEGKIVRVNSSTKPIKVQLKRNVTNKQEIQIKTRDPNKSIQDKLRESELTEGTITKYMSTLKRISVNVFQKENVDLEDYLTGDNYIKVINFIKTFPKSSVRPSIYILTVVLKLYGDMTDNIIYKKYEEFYQSIPSIQQFTRTKRSPNITMFDIEKKQREYELNIKNMIERDSIDYDYYKRYLALSIYTLMPPLRPSEWLTSRLVELAPTSDYKEYTHVVPNYIDLFSCKMVLSDYKTVKKYGIRILQLPTKLINIIKEWRNRRNRDYLFESKTRGTNEYKRMSHNAFSNMFKNIQFDNGQLVPMMIRKIYISGSVIDGELVGDERERIARIMGHSVGTQYIVYSQYSKMLWGIDPSNPDDNNSELDKE
jgi:hypothetical protein